MRDDTRLAEPVRCPWPGEDSLYVAYHDFEWGVPAYNDGILFEFLALETAQAGLSWITILRKRQNYRRAFDGFDPERIAAYGEGKIAELMEDSGIVRNRRKIESVVANARSFLKVRDEFGSFSVYAWQFVGGRPIINAWKGVTEIPVYTPEARQMSKDLIGRGFKFVGPTICYAFMQATGMVNDHVVNCFRHGELADGGQR
ncbi:MAG: DNA-3-methyladenine glycosylase I [Nitrospirae bacterium]|nr:DNA-3-methyladenine glycosylase I [Nitrospirota bacterium]